MTRRGGNGGVYHLHASVHHLHTLMSAGSKAPRLHQGPTQSASSHPWRQPHQPYRLSGLIRPKNRGEEPTVILPLPPPILDPGNTPSPIVQSGSPRSAEDASTSNLNSSRSILNPTTIRPHIVRIRHLFTLLQCVLCS